MGRFSSPDNTFNLLAESASFTVKPVTISTDQSTYAEGATITVTYAGMPGNPLDWIAVAPAGAPDTTYVAYVFTSGQTSGTATFIAPTAGTYVARAFPNNTFTLLAESPSFTVTPVTQLRRVGVQGRSDQRHRLLERASPLPFPRRVGVLERHHHALEEVRPSRQGSHVARKLCSSLP